LFFLLGGDDFSSKGQKYQPLRSEFGRLIAKNRPDILRYAYYAEHPQSLQPDWQFPKKEELFRLWQGLKNGICSHIIKKLFDLHHSSKLQIEINVALKPDGRPILFQHRYPVFFESTSKKVSHLAIKFRFK